MCIAKGAPKKPAYGPCNESHGLGGVFTGPTSTSSYYGNTVNWTFHNATSASTATTNSANWV